MKTKTCKIKELFDIQYGNSLELVYLKKSSMGVNFISRTSKQNGVSDKVTKIPYIAPFPAGLITVAVGGSVLETFLQQSPFYTGFHVMVLTPLVAMNTETKLFYCHCIRKNQYKYSYGRQANSTLAEVDIPTLESALDKVGSFSVIKYGKQLIRQVSFPPIDDIIKATHKKVPLSDLFQIENGIASSQVYRSPMKESENWVPYIRPSYRQETSIDAYVNKQLIPENKLFPSGSLYVSTDGQGSHTFSYVSTFDFVPNSNVSVLTPKRNMSIQEKLFYSQCITNNRYKFSYGRKPKGDRLKAVLLPEYPPAYIVEYNIDKAIQCFDNILEGI